MPFVVVNGIPNGTQKDILHVLRRNLVEVVSSQMEVPKEWVRPFFPVDWLDDPIAPEEGCNTIYARLDTAMFTGHEPSFETLPVSVVTAIAQVIWEAFEGKYEVEVFVGELNPKWKKLLPAQA